MAIVELARNGAGTQVEWRRPASANRSAARIRTLETTDRENAFCEGLSAEIGHKTLDELRTLMVTARLVRLYAEVTAPVGE